MLKIQITGFLLFLVGFFLLLGVSKIRRRDANISFKKLEAKKKRTKINADVTLTRFEKIVSSIDSLLKKINQTRTHLYTTMMLCFVIGVIVGQICFSSLLLSVSTGFSFVPLTYLYLVFRTQEKIREDLSDLQNAMSVITNTYLSCNDISKAIKAYTDERKTYGDGYNKALLPFEEYNARAFMSFSETQNLTILASQINNKYFNQWANNLQLCMKNRELKFALQPVVDAMIDEKVMQMESDSQMVKTWVTYLSVVAVMFAIIPTFRLARKEWFLILTQTPFGQGLIIVMLAMALWSAIRVMKINKPIGNM